MPAGGVRTVQGQPVAVQVDEVWEQWDVAVGVEFADGDTQPVRLVHGDDGVVGELAELGDAQSGARQEFDDESSSRIEPPG